MTTRDYTLSVVAGQRTKLNVRGTGFYIRSLPQGSGRQRFYMREVDLQAQDGEVSSVLLGTDESIRLPREFDRIEIDATATGFVEIIVGDFSDFRRSIPSFFEPGQRVGLYVNIQTLNNMQEFPLTSGSGPFDPSVKRIRWQADPANTGNLYLTEAGDDGSLAGLILDAGEYVWTEVNDGTDEGSENVWYSDADGNVLRWIVEFYPDVTPT